MPPDNQSGAGMAMLAELTKGSESSPAGGGLGALAGELLGVKNTGAMFIGVLRSHTVLSRLVERFNLRSVYGKQLEIDACRKLEEYTQISEDRKSGIIAITVTDHDPKRAAAIAKAYVEELDRLVSELSTSSARRERIFLEGRLTAVKQDLDLASKEFSQFASKNATLDIKEEAKAMLESTAILQGQLIAAESELQGLEQIYSDNNVRVRASQARIIELRRQIDKLGGRNDTSETATSKNDNVDSIYPSIRKLPLLGVTYADLYRQNRIEETVYESLTKEYELAKVQEAKEIPSVKVLDAPDVPQRRSFPPRLPIMFLGIICGLVAATVWIFGKEHWEEIDPDDPNKMLGLHVFHSVKARVYRNSTNGSREDPGADKDSPLSDDEGRQGL
jgi:capsule polysaccharide export protein KpsE/RkpR